jgi:hypothetical protein
VLISHGLRERDSIELVATTLRTSSNIITNLNTTIGNFDQLCIIACPVLIEMQYVWATQLTLMIRNMSIFTVIADGF